MSMSVSSIIVAQKMVPKAALGLSSLIHALFELETYAVGRLVPKDGKDPVLVLLAPSIEVDYECLLDVQLPFAEDLRSYKFPPLDKVVTVSGKILKEHRNLPGDVLTSAMSDYVDRMDLSTFGTDDEGYTFKNHRICQSIALMSSSNPAEYMAMTDTFSPVLHRIDQAVRWRAVHPTEPIPPPYDILIKYSQQPEELQRQNKNSLAKLIAAADVKKGIVSFYYRIYYHTDRHFQFHRKSKADVIIVTRTRQNPASTPETYSTARARTLVLSSLFRAAMSTR